MAIPTNDKLDRPYDDEKMTYDYTEQRYIPMVEGIVKHGYVNLVVDWKTVENAQSYLDLLSNVVVETILSFKDAKYRLQMKYYLAHSKRARIELFNIFTDSVWYNRRDGGFMMAYNSGANLNQGKLIEFGIDKALSPIAKQIIKNTFLGTRYLPYDINDKQLFDDFDALKAFLVSEGYITSTESDEALELKELPFDNKYNVFIDQAGKYVFTDLRTLSKAVEKMRIYDEVNGTW